MKANLEAKELRIGNYYNSKKFKTPIQLDINDFAELHNSCDGADIDEDTIGWHIKPIPLTEEWLIKFGFRISKSAKHIYWLLGGDYSFEY